MSTSHIAIGPQCKAMGFRGSRCSHAARVGSLCRRHATYAQRPTAPAYLRACLAPSPSAWLASTLGPLLDAAVARLANKGSDGLISVCDLHFVGGVLSLDDEDGIDVMEKPRTKRTKKEEAPNE
jgi:hypothetical protein